MEREGNGNDEELEVERYLEGSDEVQVGAQPLFIRAMKVVVGFGVEQQAKMW